MNHEIYFVMVQVVEKRKTLIGKRNFSLAPLCFYLLLEDICHDDLQTMEYKVATKKMAVCLECGDKIRYGRTDKKFCCDNCRVKYNYEQVRISQTYRRRVLAALSRNYEILDNMLKSEVESVDLLELEGLGFQAGLVTSYRKVSKHEEYSCFDIKYIMTRTRVYGIKKISLNLHIGKNR